MSEMIYFGNDASIAQQVEAIYIGDETNIARLVQQVFIGDEKGMAQLAFCAHEYGETQYEWYGDDSCTASQACSLCGHVMSEDGFVEIVWNPDNVREYNYKADFDNFEDAWRYAYWQTAECNHDFGEVSYTWSDDCSSCTASAFCFNCQSTISESAYRIIKQHVQTEDADYYQYVARFYSFNDATCSHYHECKHISTRIQDASPEEESSYGYEAGAYHYEICNTCGEILQWTKHSWDNGVVTTQPTCTAAGVRTFTCSGCRGTYTKAEPATGHKFGSWYDDGDGKCARTCSVCGHTERKTHAFGGWTEDGEKYVRICSDCQSYQECYHDECEWEYDTNDVDRSYSIYRCQKCGAILNTCQCANEETTQPQTNNNGTHYVICKNCSKEFIYNCENYKSTTRNSKGRYYCTECGYEFPDGE